MLEFKLQELFCTLGIGIYTWLFLLYFIGFFIKTPQSFVKSIFSSENDHSKTGLAIIAVILLYGFGALLQDTLGNLSRSAGVIKYSKFAPSFKRSDVLFDKKGQDTVELGSLGYTVFSEDTAIMHGINKSLGEDFFEYPACKDKDMSAKWRITDSFIKSKRSENHEKNFQTFTDRIYFISKNWCVLKSESANEELKDIQQRMDFAKSIGIISFYVGIILLILLFISLFWIIYNSSKASKFWTTLVLLSIVWGIYYTCLTTYPIEIGNFNKRVYGYYADNLNFESKETGKIKTIEEIAPAPDPTDTPHKKPKTTSNTRRHYKIHKKRHHYR